MKTKKKKTRAMMKIRNKYAAAVDAINGSKP